MKLTLPVAPHDLEEKVAARLIEILNSDEAHVHTSRALACSGYLAPDLVYIKGLIDSYGTGLGGHLCHLELTFTYNTKAKILINIIARGYAIYENHCGKNQFEDWFIHSGSPDSSRKVFEYLSNVLQANKKKLNL